MKFLILLELLFIFSCRSANRKQIELGDKIVLSLSKAEAYKQARDWKKALNEYQKVINIIPNNADLYFQKGYLDEMLHNYKECVLDFTKVLEINPSKNLTYTNRGFAYRMLGEYEKAIHDFSEEIRLNPNPYSNEHRGYVKYLLKDYEGALQDINKSIGFDSLNSISFKSRALVYFAMHNMKQGCEDLQTAKRLKIEIKYPDVITEIKKMDSICQTATKKNY